MPPQQQKPLVDDLTQLTADRYHSVGAKLVVGVPQ